MKAIYVSRQPLQPAARPTPRPTTEAIDGAHPAARPTSDSTPTMTFATAYDALRAQPLLHGLSDWQLERLAAHGKRSMFHAGCRIFNEGEPAERLWLIVDGKVVVDTDTAERGHTVVDALGPGAMLGWSWLLPPHRWHFGAVAVETTQTVELDGSSVRELCHNDPMLGYQLALAVIHVVTDRLQATRRRTPTARPGPSG
ncbi:MAG: cyclic nucleotide-binding domain-containing protein [Actinomycetes bacterium]